MNNLIKKKNATFCCAWLFLIVRALFFANLNGFGVSVAPQWVNTTLYVACLVLSAFLYLRIVLRFVQLDRHWFLFLFVLVDPFFASYHSAYFCLQLLFTLLFLRSVDPACRLPKQLRYTAILLLPCLIGIFGRSSWFSVLPLIIIVSMLETTFAVKQKPLIVLTSISAALGVAANCVLTATDSIPFIQIFSVLFNGECLNYFEKTILRNLVVCFSFILLVVFAVQMLLNKVKRQKPTIKKSAYDHASEHYVSFLLAFSVLTGIGVAMKTGGALLFVGLIPVLLVLLLGKRYGGAFDRVPEYLNRQFEKHPILYTGVLISYSAIVLLLNDMTQLFSSATNFLV